MLQIIGSRAYIAPLVQEKNSKACSIRRHSNIIGCILALFGKAFAVSLSNENHQKKIYLNINSTLQFKARFLLAEQKALKGKNRLETLQKVYKQQKKPKTPGGKWALYLTNECRKILPLAYKPCIKDEQLIRRIHTPSLQEIDNTYKGVFYKLKKSGKTVGYLTGTMHKGLAKMAPLPKKISEAVCKSHHIFFEQNMSASDFKELNRRKEVFLKRRWARDLFFRADFGTYQEAKKALNDDPNKEGKQQRLQSQFGIETLMIKILAKIGEEKSFSGLENLATRTEMARKEVDRLRRKPKKNSPTTERLVEIYMNGDVEQLYHLMKDGDDYKDVIVDRNSAMVSAALPKLRKASPSRRYCIAVGAAHLSGPDGMQTLLQRAGFDVVRC